MRFAIFKGEKSVAKLIARLFRIPDSGAKATTRQTADALLRANPQLKYIRKVPAGSLIAIPASAPALVPGEEVTSVAGACFFAAQNIQTAFDFLQQRLSDIDTAASDQLRSGMDGFQAPDVKAALKIAAGASFVFPGQRGSSLDLSKSAQKLFKNIESAAGARQQVQTQLQKALATFAK